MIKNIKRISALLVVIMVVLVTTAIVRAANPIEWPTAVVNQSDMVNTNYPGGAWTASYAGYGKGEYYSTTERGNGSQAAIEWNGYINNDAIPGMSKPLGQQELVSKKNFMLEDTFNYDPTDIEDITLYTPVFVPICLDKNYCKAAEDIGSGAGALLAKGKPACGTTDAEECYYRASSGVPLGQKLNFNFKDLMTKLTQNPGETLAQFRTRVSQNAMTYGIYNYNGDMPGITPGSVASNSKTLIINFGEIGHNGLNISKATLNYTQNGVAKTISGSDDAIYGILADKLLGTNGVSNGGTSNYRNFLTLFPNQVLPDNIHELLTNYYKDVYGPDNLTKGDVAWFAINSTLNYQPSANGFGIGNALEKLKGLTNTPFISYDVKNSTTGELENKKVQSANSYPGGMQATSIAAAQPKEAVLYLFNRTYSYSSPLLISTVDGALLASKNYVPPISGATFTLQKLDGTTWTNVQTNLVTGADGTIKVSGLADGSYRFVETAPEDDSNYQIPWSLRDSCLNNITNENSGTYNSTTAANGFGGNQKVGCNWDENDKALVSNQFTISSSQGANIYIPNIINPLKNIYYDVDGGTPATYVTSYQKNYTIGAGLASLSANSTLMNGKYLPTREGYEFVGWCETKTETNGVEHGQDCGYEDTSDPNVLIPKPFDKVMNIPNTYNWDVYLKAMWKSNVVSPIAPGIEYTDGTAIATTVDDLTGNVTITDPSALICEKDLQLVIPSVDNLTYTSEKITADGVYPEQYKVIATPAAGYALNPTDARTEWIVIIPDKETCETPQEVSPIAPGIKYVDNSNLVASTIDANGNVTVSNPNDLACGKELTYALPVVEHVEYTVTKTSADDAYPITYSITATATDGYQFGQDVTRTEWTVIILQPTACSLDKVSLLAPGIKYVGGNEVLTDVDANGVVTVSDMNAIECGKELEAFTPTVEHVTYSAPERITAEGVYPAQYKVTATIEDGYTTEPEDAITEWIVVIPEVQACPVTDKEVTPIAPTLDKNVACEKDYKIIIPTQEGVIYTKGEKVNGKITVTATPADGYVFTSGADTEWTFDVTNPNECPVKPEKPNPGKPTPEKPEPGKPTPEKPNPGKPTPEKPEPNKPSTQKPSTGTSGTQIPETGNIMLMVGLSLLGLSGITLVSYKRFIKNN